MNEKYLLDVFFTFIKKLGDDLFSHNFSTHMTYFSIFAFLYMCKRSIKWFCTGCFNKPSFGHSLAKIFQKNFSSTMTHRDILMLEIVARIEKPWKHLTDYEISNCQVDLPTENNWKNKKSYISWSGSRFQGFSMRAIDFRIKLPLNG